MTTEEKKEALVELAEIYDREICDKMEEIARLNDKMEYAIQELRKLGK